MSDRIALSLTRDEALVLFDWLSRFEAENEKVDADQKVLWGLEAQLERLLVEPLAPNYRELLDGARRRVLEDEPGP